MGQMISTETIRDLLRRSGLKDDKIDAFLRWAEENGLVGSVINASTPAAELARMARSPVVTALAASHVRMSTTLAWGADDDAPARRAEIGSCTCEPYRKCPDHARRYNESMGY